MLAGICIVLQQPRFLHPLRGHRNSSVGHLLQEETIPGKEGAFVSRKPSPVIYVCMYKALF